MHDGGTYVVPAGTPKPRSSLYGNRELHLRKLLFPKRRNDRAMHEGLVDVDDRDLRTVRRGQRAADQSPMKVTGDPARFSVPIER
jgi:hypothetical protein